MGRKRINNRSGRMTVAVACFFLLSGLAVTSLWVIKFKAGPNLEEIGRIRAKVMVNQIVNAAISRQLDKDDTMQELLVWETDRDGKTEILQANTKAMNLFMTELSKELQAEYKAHPEDVYTVPAGVLLGSRFLSRAGPDIDIHIIPLSVASMDFKTEFESQGINQTKYKIYLTLVTDIKAMVPFSSDHFQVSTTIPVAEAVILGNVPSNYVYVPEEDILDVTQE